MSKNYKSYDENHKKYYIKKTKHQLMCLVFIVNAFF